MSDKGAQTVYFGQIVTINFDALSTISTAAAPAIIRCGTCGATRPDPGIPLLDERDHPTISGLLDALKAASLCDRCRQKVGAMTSPADLPPVGAAAHLSQGRIRQLRCAAFDLVALWLDDDLGRPGGLTEEILSHADGDDFDDEDLLEEKRSFAKECIREVIKSIQAAR